jgi:hypothetical protein
MIEIVNFIDILIIWALTLIFTAQVRLFSPATRSEAPASQISEPDQRTRSAKQNLFLQPFK